MSVAVGESGFGKKQNKIVGADDGSRAARARHYVDVLVIVDLSCFSLLPRLSISP